MSLEKLVVLGVLCLIYIWWFYARQVPAYRRYIDESVIFMLRSVNRDLPADYDAVQMLHKASVWGVIATFCYLVGFAIYYFFFT
ncbi:hypothetical protein D3C81_304900 [compost metagenome]